MAKVSLEIADLIFSERLQKQDKDKSCRCERMGCAASSTLRKRLSL